MERQGGKQARPSKSAHVQESHADLLPKELRSEMALETSSAQREPAGNLIMSMLPGKVSEAWVVAINDTNSLSLLNFRLISMSHFCSKVTRGALLGSTRVKQH